MKIMQQSLPQWVTPQHRPATNGGAPEAAQMAAAPKADTFTPARPVRFAGGWHNSNMTKKEVRQALKAGKPVDEVDKLGWTALTCTAGFGKPDIVKLLLAKGADVNHRSNSGLTPLMLAASNGKSNIVKLLLAKGADVNHQDNDGNTALTKAAEAGHHNVAKLLLAKGADVNHKTNDGSTARTLAAGKGHRKVVELLERHIQQQEKKLSKITHTGQSSTNTGQAASSPFRKLLNLFLYLFGRG